MSTPNGSDSVSRMRSLQTRVEGTDLISVVQKLQQDIRDLQRVVNAPATAPVGWISAPAVPGTGSPVFNSYGRTATVYITGGGVTIIAVDGIPTGTTTGAVRVNPGASLAIAYTTAPTWKWYVD